MQQLIEQLYKGELYSCEQMEIRVPEYATRFNSAKKLEFKFKARLSDTTQAELDNLIDEYDRVKYAELEQAFVEGYKLATGLLIESLSP